MKIFLNFFNYIKFFISFYFTSYFNYKINKIKEKEYYLDLQKKYLSKGELYQIRNFEIKNKNSIDRVWLNKLALHTQVTLKKSEINYEHGKILYSALCNYLNNRKNKTIDCIILETGSAKGFSSICMSKALIDCNQSGEIFTIDLIPHKSKRYWNVIDDFEGKKTREDLLKNWKFELENVKFITGNINSTLKEIDLKYINFAFIDSIHTSSQILKEFKYISNRQGIGDLIILDDIDTNYNRHNEPNFKYLLDNYPNYKFEFIESFFPRCYAVAKKIK